MYKCLEYEQWVWCIRVGLRDTAEIKNCGWIEECGGIKKVSDDWYNQKLVYP